MGERHVCANLRLIGIDRDGGLSGRVVVDPERVHVVPDGLDPVVAALAEPLAVAVHATRRADVGVGDTIVIMGAGPIGLLLALAARRVGAATILIGETCPGPAGVRRVARFRDARHRWIRSATSSGGHVGRLADVAFDAAAVPAVAALLPRLVRPAGRIGLVGTYGRPVELDLQAVLFRELTVLGNRVYQPADIDAALRDAGGRPGGVQTADQRSRRARRGAGGVRAVARGRGSQVPRRDGWAFDARPGQDARGVGHLALQERPEPEAGAGWVKIAVRYAGICGTDLHIVHDEFPYWPPVTLGHEFMRDRGRAR